MELHRSLGVAMNMTGRWERAAANLLLISVQSASGEGRQVGEMLCPSFSSPSGSPLTYCSPDKGSTTGFLLSYPLTPHPQATRAPFPCIQKTINRPNTRRGQDCRSAWVHQSAPLETRDLYQEILKAQDIIKPRALQPSSLAGFEIED